MSGIGIGIGVDGVFVVATFPSIPFYFSSICTCNDSSVDALSHSSKGVIKNYLQRFCEGFTSLYLLFRLKGARLLRLIIFLMIAKYSKGFPCTKFPGA